MFALVDVNNMYCSVERSFDPRLEGRPLVVLSSNDGACIARSIEAKDLGVQMAQPWFRQGFNYTKADVMLMELLSCEAAKQQQEFDFIGGTEPGKATAAGAEGTLMTTMDDLNRRFGRGAVRIGSATTAAANRAGTASWSVRQERRTPRYTTRWDEMQSVRC